MHAHATLPPSTLPLPAFPFLPPEQGLPTDGHTSSHRSASGEAAPHPCSGLQPDERDTCNPAANAAHGASSVEAERLPSTSPRRLLAGMDGSDRI
eukprot:366228-Chlamydomonas_euryale.AAC.11